ncbi:MAG: DICT sensory domain-containing protein [Halobacteriota archaeon]|uniref:DICT sensory domain-containing protein n=1 Tax=Natronomonas sp. TaxID=2184060 RepID=UPI003976C11A
MLGSLLEGTRRSDIEVTLYGNDDAETIAGWFDGHGVELARGSLPSGGPESFVVIERDGEFAGALGVSELAWLLEPPIVRPTDREGISEGYRALFDALDDTVFSAMTRRELLAVSREVEDRAYRVGTGTLRVGFQTPAAFDAQLEGYRRLAADTDLEIHVYSVDPAAESRSNTEGITLHRGNETIDRYWVLAFDGGDDETQACGLLAQDRVDGYSGFWTNDGAIVTKIAAELTTI